MKPTVLLYNFTDSKRKMKVQQALMPLGFRLRAVKKEEYGLLTPLFWKDGTPVERNTWFFYPKSKRLSPALSQFVEYVAEGAKAGKNRK